jgi:hypothetical protein
VVKKHGNRVVVIVFSILSGDLLPAIIQNAMNPDEPFYRIVLLTLPYTGAVVVTLLLLSKWWSDEHPFGIVMGVGLIFMLFFLLCYSLHLGITDTEADRVSEQIQRVNYVPPGAAHKNPVIAMANIIGVFLKFYYYKYGLVLFVAATLAAPVIVWPILTRNDAKKS